MLASCCSVDDDAIIHMSYGGRIWFDEAVLPALGNTETRHLIDPSRYYFRTNPVFETGHQKYLWLNGVVGIGNGRLIEGGGVAYDVFEVNVEGRVWQGVCGHGATRVVHARTHTSDTSGIPAKSDVCRMPFHFERFDRIFVS